MRATLAIYAIRFGGWLLAKATGSHVYVGVDVCDDPAYGPEIHLEREYVG